MWYSSVNMKLTWFTRKESLKNMKIYKTKNRGHLYFKYILDEDEMDSPKNPKPTKAQKIFFGKDSLVDIEVAYDSFKTFVVEK